MNIEELAPLTEGLTVPCGPSTFVCDRAQVTPRGDAVEMKFLIAGTDHMPRVRVRRDLVERWTREDAARAVRHVAQQAMGPVEDAPLVRRAVRR